MDKKLPAEIKTAWLAALRDPEAKQTKGKLWRTLPSLDRPPGKCCLGVLATILDPEAFIEYAPDLQGWRRSDAVNTVACVLELADATERQINEALTQELETAEGPFHAETYLTTLNDSGKSFPEIADWIEENL